MTHVRPAPHECKFNWNLTPGEAWPWDPLAPYWGLRKFVQSVGGGATISAEIDGEPWQITLRSQKSGLAPRDADEVESLYEYRIRGEGYGERKASFLIRPRWGDPALDKHAMRTVSPAADPLSVPESFGEGINIRGQGSNLDPEEYQPLLEAFIERLNEQTEGYLNPRYFSIEPHKTSNADEFELYVRYDKSEMAKVSGATEGVLQRIQHFLGEIGGTRYTLDVDDRREQGWRHEVRLKSKATVREAFGDVLPGGPHRGVQMKSYLVRDPDAHSDPEDPLHHPKFGILFRKKDNESESVPWAEIGGLRREIEAKLVNVLSWAGLSIDPDSGVYIADKHFQPEPSRTRFPIVEDPTPEIERQEERFVHRYLIDGFNPSDLDLLEEVATDGGASSPKGIAEKTGWHYETILDARSRLDPLLEHSYGEVRPASPYVVDLVRDVVEKARANLEKGLTAVRWAEDRVEDSLIAYLRANQIEIDPRKERLFVRIGKSFDTRGDLSRALERLLDKWRASGEDPSRLRSAKLEGTITISGQSARFPRSTIADVLSAAPPA